MIESVNYLIREYNIRVKNKGKKSADSWLSTSSPDKATLNSYYRSLITDEKVKKSDLSKPVVLEKLYKIYQKRKLLTGPYDWIMVPKELIILGIDPFEGL